MCGARVASPRTAKVIRAWRRERERFSVLTLIGILAAVASLGAVGLPVAWPTTLPFAPLLMVLQIAVISCIIGTRAVMSRRLRVLEELAEHDPATGCLNRRGFARALDTALANASATGSDVALLALDVDHFKRINDAFGHSVGDAVLCDVAAALTEIVCDAGVVARLGGEEFSVLLPSADAEAAGVMAERMLARVRLDEGVAHAHGAAITMSVGIAVERVTSLHDSAAIRARSDEALYVAKRAGRNRVLLWAPGVRSLAMPAAAAAAITRPPRHSGLRSCPTDFRTVTIPGAGCLVSKITCNDGRALRVYRLQDAAAISC